MKLFRFEKKDGVGLGLLTSDGKHLDISSFGQDLNEHSIEKGILENIASWIPKNIENCEEIAEPYRFESCIARPSKIICIGLNYSRHAKETGMEAPAEPIIFFKSTSALCGPNDPVIIPKGSQKTDWEVELALIIGKKTSYASEETAMQNLAGYCLHNDYSERAFQLERGGQWVKGKSADHFAPLGPYFVTKDEIKDHHNLHLWLDLNGKRMQNSNTSDLIFKIPFLISYVSQFMTLLPGDVISTGTPEGVGMGQKPALYLKPGDQLHLGIEGLGEQRQIAIAHEN